MPDDQLIALINEVITEPVERDHWLVAVQGLEDEAERTQLQALLERQASELEGQRNQRQIETVALGVRLDEQWKRLDGQPQQ